MISFLLLELTGPCCECGNVVVDSKLEIEERTISAEFILKLVNENFVVPDPISLKDG